VTSADTALAGRRGGPDPRIERFLPRAIRVRWTFVVRALAVAGAFVCAGQILRWDLMGAWPPHDTADIWLAGRHLLEGRPVYFGLVTQFLVFVYSPPIAIIAAPLSLLPLDVLSVVLLLAEILAFRWVAGSWVAVGLWSWLPFVPRELVTGNVDFLVAAAIYGAVRNLRGSGAVAALFAFVKFSPALAVRRWREFIVASVVLAAITIPWFSLWPAWIQTMRDSLGVPTDTIPILPRLPVVAVLLLLRRPWSIAAAAAFATPAFYFHSWILLLPAIRLSSTVFGRGTDEREAEAPAR
jgi:hypothetical protein